MNRKHLNFGVYQATEAFRAIELHSCVCFDDMGLVAVTGPAEDADSQEYAELFATAPDMLENLEYIADAINCNHGGWDEEDVITLLITGKAANDILHLLRKIHHDYPEFSTYTDAQGNEHAEF